MLPLHYTRYGLVKHLPGAPRGLPELKIPNIVRALFEARLDGFGLFPKDSLVPHLCGSLAGTSGDLSTHQFIDAIASKIACVRENAPDYRRVFVSKYSFSFPNGFISKYVRS